MVFRRSKLNKLSKEEQIEELVTFEEINLPEKINNLTKKLGDFPSKFDLVFSELQISKTCNSLLRRTIIDLERSTLNNPQYLRREMIEISLVNLNLSNVDWFGKDWFEKRYP